MNQQTIPENNLPIYLQNYTASVQCKANICGSVRYSTVGVIPSDLKEKRVWNFKVSGILKPTKDIIQIIFNFQNVEYDEEITFENQISGYLTICGRVLDLSKSGFYEYNSLQRILVIGISQERWGFSIKRETNFYLNVDIDDSSSQAVSDENFTYFQLCPNIDTKLALEFQYNIVTEELDFTLIGAPPTGTYPTPSGTPVPSCPCDSTPCPTYLPCPPSTPCPTPIAQNCLRSFTDGLSFDYPEVMKNTDDAFVRVYINGVGYIDTIANPCYNTVQNFPFYIGKNIQNNDETVWELQPFAKNQYIAGPVLYMVFKIVPEIKTIRFEQNVNFGAYTLLQLDFNVQNYSDVESVQNCNIIINCQSLNINDNPFAIINQGFVPCDGTYPNKLTIYYNIIYNINPNYPNGFYTLEPVIPFQYDASNFNEPIQMFPVGIPGSYGFQLFPTPSPSSTPSPSCTSASIPPSTSSTFINVIVNNSFEESGKRLITFTYGEEFNNQTINQSNIIPDSISNLTFKNKDGNSTPLSELYQSTNPIIDNIYLYVVSTQLQSGDIYVFCSSYNLKNPNNSYLFSLMKLSAQMQSIIRYSENIKCTSETPPSIPCPTQSPLPTAFPSPTISCQIPSPNLT